ncbi:MAG: AAA family ATPase [Pseudomonadota bacterium]
MSAAIVAFTGISGVGKTTFLRRLAERVPFQHLTGGSLIAAACKARPDERDALRYADLNENQRLLIDGFDLARDPAAACVILDAHVVIDSGDGLEELSAEVFRALGITKMVHLEAEPVRISANRSNDTTRQRPTYDQEILAQHQLASRACAKSIAAALKIDFHVVTHIDVEHLAISLLNA